MEPSIDVKTVTERIMAAINEFKTEARKEIDQIKNNGVADPETKEAIDKAVKRMDDLEARYQRPHDGIGPMSKTIAALFVDSEEYKARKGGYATGQVHLNFHLKDRSFFEQKTTITTGAGSGADAVGQVLRVPGIIGPQLRELRLRDMLPIIPIRGTNGVEYVRENVFTNAAAPVVEAAAKPEAAITFTKATAAVRTIAHWVPASRQILDDAPALQAYIESRLMYGLKLVEEAQLLTGDGTGENLNGLITQATAYDSATYNQASDNRMDTIRHAILQARIAEYPVDGVVLHPADWERMETSKDLENRYLIGDPGQMIGKRLWGRNIVETTAITTGTFLVGAFALGAAIYDSMSATIDISTEHSDYFVKNLVAIRCEERLALAVYRPAAFITGSFPA